MNSRNLVIHISRFIILILLQALVFNKLLIFGYINPQIYILFILLLPIETPRWLLLISAFTIGIISGMFTNSAGAHAAATTLIAYIRPFLITRLTEKRELEVNTSPNIKEMGFRWFIIYSTILVSIHHFSFFFLEAFSFNLFQRTILLCLGTILCSLILIIVSQYIIPVKRKSL